MGVPTKGALLGNLGTLSILPNSGIPVTLSGSLFLYYDETVYDESIGFLPDLWVPEDSLNRVQSFIEQYGLNESPAVGAE